MLEDPSFWRDEANSTLVWRTLDGFPEDQLHDAILRVQKWAVLLPGAQQVDVNSIRIKPVDQVHLQQLTEDANAIFRVKDNPELEVRSAKRRQLHVDTVKLICSQVQDYDRGLGLVVAFLQMMLKPEDIVQIVLALHSSAKHNRGYFRAHSESYAGDANMLWMLLQEQLPAVGAHLAQLGVSPSVFAHRWFVGVAVNLLPLRELMDYFEAYFQYGYEFLVAFGIEFLREFSTEILAESVAEDVYAILRMEDRYKEWQYPAQFRHHRASFCFRLASIIERALKSIESCCLGDEGRLESMRKGTTKDVKAETEDRLAIDPHSVPIVDSDSDGL